MPFINLNTEGVSGVLKPYDITIIGAGAVGIMLALKLSRKNLKVLLLEHGNFGEQPDKQKVNVTEQIGKKMVSDVNGRKRSIGGTTIAWGGQSLPFTSFDFLKKEWVELSGWPIEKDDLRPYYSEANEFMKVDRLNYRDDILKLFKIKAPDFDPMQLNYHYSKWAPEPNFYVLYKKDLEANVDVLYNAHVTDLQSTGSIIKNILIKCSSLKSYSLPVQKLVVASGGIESVRLLLNCINENQLQPGNHSGWLGKCFMEHPCLDAGLVHPADNFNFQKYFNSRSIYNKKYSVRVSLSDQMQQKAKLLNCSISMMFYPKINVANPYDSLKSFLGQKSLKNLIAVLKSSPVLLRSIVALFHHRFYFKLGTTPTLAIMSEQEPSLKSTIELSTVKDIYGLNSARINWSISTKTWETIVHTALLFKSEFERLGFGRISLFPEVRSDQVNWQEYLCDVNHHMGGARMSNKSETGVVDPNLQVWETENLFICSSSVFVTGSHSNPTLTLLALAARLGDYLLQQKDVT